MSISTKNIYSDRLLAVISKSIDDAIEQAISEAFDSAIEKAVEDASNKKDEVISSTALKILSYYSIQDMGNHLEITIKKDNVKL